MSFPTARLFCASLSPPNFSLVCSFYTPVVLRLHVLGAIPVLNGLNRIGQLLELMICIEKASGLEFRQARGAETSRSSTNFLLVSVPVR